MSKTLCTIAALLAVAISPGQDAISVPDAPVAADARAAAAPEFAALLADCNGNSTPDDTEFLTGPDVIYQIDNGTAVGSAWFFNGGTRSKFMNRFTVAAGGEYLTEISGVTGTQGSGERMSLLVYRDPNNDGNPIDAELLAEVASGQQISGATFVAQVSPPVYLGQAGDRFFLGYRMNHNSDRNAWRFDTGTSPSSSSFEEFALDELHTSTSALRTSGSSGRNGTLMIRGKGRAAAFTDCNRNGILDACDASCAAPLVRAVNRNSWDAAKTSVNYHVLFTEPVTGVDAADFSYTATGSVAAGAPITVTPLGTAGTAYLVSFSTLQGVGTVTLNVLANGSIIDGDGNPLAAPFTGATFMVDGRRAEVVSASRLDPENVTASAPVRFDVEFDRAVHRAGFLATIHGSTSVAVASTPDAGAPFDTGLDLPATGTPHATVPSHNLFAGDFTVEAWVYPRSFNNWSRIIDFGNGPNNSTVLLALTVGGSGLPYFELKNGATVIGAARSRRQLPLNAWSHVAATVSGTQMRLYIDGVQEGQFTMTAPLTPVTRTQNYIGRSVFASDAYANAVYDDIRIWNVARTREQIVAAMETPIPPSTPGLAAYWRFDENTGTVSADLTGNGLDATFVGTGWAPERGLGGDRFEVTLTPSGRDGLFGTGFLENAVYTTSDVPSLPFVSASRYRYDSTVPAVTSITRRDASPTNAGTVTWDVEFSEAITGASAADAYTTASATLAGSGPASLATRTPFAGSLNRISSKVQVPGVAQELDGGEITVEAWVNTRAFATQTLFTLHPDTSTNRFLAHIGWIDGRIYWDHGNIDAGGRISQPTGPSFIGNWRHIALTSSLANSRKRIYVDGALLASSTLASPLVPAGIFEIGGDFGNYPWGGEVREFRIWTRELTVPEIVAASAAEIRAPQPDLLLALAFDGFEDLGIGTAGTNDIRDYSGNGFHGDAANSSLVMLEQPTRGVLTANSGSGTAYLAPGIADDDSILDLVGRPLGSAYADGEPYFVDTEAPAAIATGPATKVEGAVSASLAITENGVGLNESASALYLRETGGNWALHAATTLTTDTLAFTPPGDGVWHYAVLAQDTLGNVPAAPSAQAAVPGEQVTIYNDVANSTFTHAIAAGGSRSYTFPMEEPNRNLVLAMPEVSTAGALTVSRTESNAGAASAGLNTALLIGESWTIAPSPMPTLEGAAEATFRYDEALLGPVDENAGITGAFAVEGSAFTLYSGSDVSVDAGQNLINVTGIGDFSDWYFGAANASADEWMLLD